MKIRATCTMCEKDLLLGQLIETGGRCPSCGEAMQKDYAAVLVDAVEAAESAGATFENALEKMAELGPKFRLQKDSALSSLERSVNKLN